MKGINFFSQVKIMEIKPSMDISKVFEKARIENDVRKERRDEIRRIESKVEKYLDSELFFIVEEDNKSEFEKIISKILQTVFFSGIES